MASHNQIKEDISNLQQLAANERTKLSQGLIDHVSFVSLSLSLSPSLFGWGCRYGQSTLNDTKKGTRVFTFNLRLSRSPNKKNAG